MSRLKRPSHSTVAAYLALFIALGGGSFALAALSGKEKKVVKRLANAQITKRAPNLSVKEAGAADTAANAEHAGSADELTCGPPVAGTGEMVAAGAVCIDKYEASVWTQPNGGTQLTSNAQLDAACPDNGQPQGAADCEDFYARSVAAVVPANSITWFQAQQALANSGKRLSTNAEWQQAVSGTPDSSACNVSTGPADNTGANTGCVSRFGAFDMVGNVWEWVADWDEQATFDCVNWPAGFGSDVSCFGASEGDTSTRLPGALARGGDFNSDAGRFALDASVRPSEAVSFGFRGAR